MDKPENSMDSLEHDLDAILRDSVSSTPADSIDIPVPPAHPESDAIAASEMAEIREDATSSAQKTSTEAPASPATPQPAPTAKPAPASAPAPAPAPAQDSPYFDQFARDNRKAADLAAKSTRTERSSGPHWLSRFIPYIFLGGIGALILLLAGALAAPWDFMAPSLQKQLSELFGQPVSVTGVRLKFLPSPHLSLDKVTIGLNHEMQVGTFDLYPTVGAVFNNDKQINRIHLDQVEVSTQQLQQMLAYLARTDSGKRAVKQVNFDNTVIQYGQATWPTLAGTLDFGPDGHVTRGQLHTTDHTLSATVNYASRNWAISVEATNWTPPFASVVKLDSLSAKGEISDNTLRLTELNGAMYGGFFTGSTELSWQAPWRLRGDIDLKGIDPATATPSLLPQTAFRGSLSAHLNFDTSAPSPEQLWQNVAWQGNFRIEDGTLSNIDLARAIQEDHKLFSGGETRFSSFTGNIQSTAAATRLSSLKMNSGLIEANGDLSVQQGNQLNGRITAHIARPDNRFNTVLTIDGTIGAPNLRK